MNSIRGTKITGSLVDQIADQFRRNISSGEWKVGATIPSETALAQLLEVSRNTVREAVARLLVEERLRIRRGIGTIVLEPPSPPVPIAVGLYQSLTNAITSSGHLPSFKLHKIKIDEAKIEEAKELGLSEGEPIIYVEREIRSDDQLLSFSYEYYPCRFFGEDTSLAIFENSFFEIFKHFNIEVDSVQVKFRAIHSKKIGWEKNASPDDLFLLLDRTHLKAGSAVFHAKTYCIEGRHNVFTTASRASS